MEEWKRIAESNYEVSNLGNVRNISRKNVLKPKAVKHKCGYVRYDVDLDLDGLGQKHYKVHRLVALAFIPNPENRIEIDHIDRNTANNVVSNLRWSTREEQNYNTKTRKDSKVGERNIHFRKNYPKCYIVSGKRIKKSRCFTNIPDAVAYRDACFEEFKNQV